MPALQVKDFPSDLYDGLRSCAVASDRSISQQTVHIIREYLEAYSRNNGLMDVGASPSEHYGKLKCAPQSFEQARSDMRDREGAQERIEKRKRIFERIDSRPELEISDDFPDVVELIHEGREERMNSIAPELEDIQ